MKKAWTATIAIIVGFALFTDCVAAPPLYVPEEGAYLGAFADFGFMEDFVIPGKLEDFEKLSGKKLALVAMGSFWGKDDFPEGQVQVIRKYGAIPVIYWYPWGPPYEKNEFQQRYSLKSIIEGRHDDYIKKWARGLKASGTPVIVAFAPEMNGNWYSWSGSFNGGEESNFGNPNRPDGPERYVFAYRHVVDVVRSSGVRNVMWLFHTSASSGVHDWNTIDLYYPGDDYVDWVGVSAFGKQFPEEEWVSFEDLFDEAYNRLTEIAPEKPILVITSVGEFEDYDKAEWITEAYGLIKERYTEVKAVIWWQDSWLNDDNTFSDLGIDSSDDALRAYRLAVSDPYFIA